MWNRSSTWRAWPAFLATTVRYGCHMSLQMNRSACVRSLPNHRKNRRSVDAPRLADPQEPRVPGVDLKIVDQGEYRCPCCHWISSMPTAAIPVRSWCARPSGNGHGHNRGTRCPRWFERSPRPPAAQALRPPRQEPRVGGRQLVFPLRPLHALDAHTAARRAGDPAHPIQEEDAEAQSGTNSNPAPGAFSYFHAAAPAPRDQRGRLSQVPGQISTSSHEVRPPPRAASYRRGERSARP